MQFFWSVVNKEAFMDLRFHKTREALKDFILG